MIHLLNNYQRGVLYATLSGLFYGLVGYFGITLVNAGFSISAMLFWRFLVSFLFTLIFILLNFRTINDNLRSLFYVFVSGIVFFGIGSNLFFTASQYLGTGLSMVIIFTFPGIVLLFEKFFWKRHFERSVYYSITIMFAGLFLFADFKDIKLDLIGIGISLLGAINFAFFFIVNKKINISSPFLSTLVTSLGGVFCCIIICYFTDSFAFPRNSYEFLNIIGIGIICTALPILFSINALKYISATKVSALCILEPIFVVLFGVSLLDEPISLLKIIGISIVLSGALIITFAKDKTKNVMPNSPA